MYKIEYYKKALKDVLKLKASELDKKAKLLIDIIRIDPFQNSPPYESYGSIINVGVRENSPTSALFFAKKEA